MEIRRERFDSEAARALADALEAELLEPTTACPFEGGAGSFVRLEAGRLQAPAIGLYVSAGFGPIPRYGPFANDPRSVRFEKRLR